MRLTLPALLLLAAPALANDPAVVVRKSSDTTLDLVAGTETVAKYQFAGTVQVEKGEGTKPLAKPFFYPLVAPGGLAVTRSYPMKRNAPGETTDHFHQKSAWFCHGDVIAEGLALKEKSSDKRVHGIDFWAETPGHGRIVCVEVGAPGTVSGVHAYVPTRNEWRAPDGTKVLDESRTIHLVQLPAGYLIVLDIDLHASVCPITFGDTKEGSMGVRVSDAFRTQLKDGGTVTSSTGEVVKAPTRDNLVVWGKPADWHDYSGQVDGKPAGIAVFDAPTNQPRALWHTRAYGLMAANPFGRSASGFPAAKGKTDLVKLAKGDHLKLRYGVYTHAGDASAGKVAEAYAAFAKMK
jgi:hypothetical protein